LQRVRADDLRQAVSAVRGRLAHGTHLAEAHTRARLRGLPSGLHTREPAADDDNFPHTLSTFTLGYKIARFARRLRAATLIRCAKRFYVVRRERTNRRDDAGEAGLLRGESLLDIFNALFEIIILLAHLGKCMAGPAPHCDDLLLNPVESRLRPIQTRIDFFQLLKHGFPDGTRLLQTTLNFILKRREPRVHRVETGFNFIEARLN